MSAEFQPQAIHASFLAAIDQYGGDKETAIAGIKARIARMVVDKVVEAIAESPGGVVVTPFTYTVNVDESLGQSRIAGTVNVQRLPDPDEPFMRLLGGRMHDRLVRVGPNPPATYFIPWVAPVAISDTPIDGRPSGLTLEYRREPGTMLYRFVREHGA